MTFAGRTAVAAMVIWTGAAAPALAQDRVHLYVGGLFGVSTLSADARSVTAPPQAFSSLYKPEDGPAVNVFVGVHLGRYFSLQGNYVWNRNDLTLFSSFVSPAGGGFYEQQRSSSQHAVVADALLYFRARGSGVRPYLSVGVGPVHFTSSAAERSTAGGLPPPEGSITETVVGLRVAVGIDLAMGHDWSFRYSFSETISSNPVSARLTPPAERRLANFQNLFGIVRRL